MDDMAVDSDEEVDYSKMDQVWSWKDGWGQLFLSTYPLPYVSVPRSHLPSAAAVGAAALWGLGQLNCLFFFCLFYGCTRGTWRFPG